MTKEERMIDQAIKNIKLLGDLTREIERAEFYGQSTRKLKQDYEQAQKLWIQATEYLEEINSVKAAKLGLLDN